MHYPKKFFFATLFVVFLFFALVGLLWSNPYWLLLGILFAVGGVFGRLSNSLASRFARRSLVVLKHPAILSILSKCLNRSLIPSAKLNGKTASGDECPYENFAFDRTLDQLKATGLKVSALPVDEAALQAYIDKANYPGQYPRYYANSSHFLKHKIFQHAITCQLAPPEKGQIWMDVASSSSPFAEILMRHEGVVAYRQDLSYPKGVHGLTIGGNAANIPLPDASIDRISLHCSFEHFEGDSDSGFIQEAGRILKPGGIACIVPIYLCDQRHILSNPRYWFERGIPAEADTPVAVSGIFWESHGRFYDAQSLNARVIQPALKCGLKPHLHRVFPPPSFNYPPFTILTVTRDS